MSVHGTVKRVHSQEFVTLTKDSPNATATVTAGPSDNAGRIYLTFNVDPQGEPFEFSIESVEEFVAAARKLMEAWDAKDSRTLRLGVH